MGTPRVHENAGRVVRSGLIDISRLRNAYASPEFRQGLSSVEFGTSGHRGSALKDSFNREHIEAISQAICDYRKKEGISGPLFIGIDSHASSLSALQTSLEVFAANKIDARIEENQMYEDGSGYTPTPAISHAIIQANKKGLNADGIVITPSHNPAEDGGFKYNPGNGGPADSDITGWIQNRANDIMSRQNADVKKENRRTALSSPFITGFDFVTPYVNDLPNVVNIDAIIRSGIKFGVDPLGGSSLEYYQAIKETFGLKNMTIVNPDIDMTFGFMPRDWDGKIRMDCSSPYAMKNLVALKDKYDVAWGNDTDSDRHGIVTPSMGLMNPNHFLSVAIWYLMQNRPTLSGDLMIGKTAVTTSLIERIAAGFGRKVYETPVGFKYFADGLAKGTLLIGCEESAGASFLRMDGSAWTTDKDGIILGLLAAEIRAVTGKDPGQIFLELTKQYGMPYYRRIDSAADRELKAAIKSLDPSSLTATTLAGEPITNIATSAPFGGKIGGLKISTENGWLCVRPSGTEDVAKVYGESLKSEAHLNAILDGGVEILNGLK